MKSKYILTLQDGKTIEVKLLEHPVYRCQIFGDASDHFKTLEEISNDSREIKILDKDDPYKFATHIGYCRDEQALFDVYKGLRNPIVKLELKDQSSEKKFLVLSGNEYGVSVDDETEFMNVVDAELKYSELVENEEDFSVAMYTIKNDKLVAVKSWTEDSEEEENDDDIPY